MMVQRDLFEPIVLEERLDPRFRSVAFDRAWAPARATMRGVFERMGDRDGNFVQQFQSDAFDARVWELYLFAAFDDAGFDIGLETGRPDFLLSGHGFEWAVEATIANPPGGDPPPPPLLDPERRRAYMEGELVVRLGGALYSKLQKQYWELPHVQDKPLVFALQSFASEDSLTFADTSLLNYLYALKTHGHYSTSGRLRISNEKIDAHTGSTKSVPSGFFDVPGAEHVSAVLWSNSGTAPKFARMGFQRGLDSAGIAMIRSGTRYVMDPDASKPAQFAYDVGARWETWQEGLVMAHNPRALKPLPREAFPGIVHHELDNGLVTSWIPPFHPFQSTTSIVVAR
jgi:hypothetical protein